MFGKILELIYCLVFGEIILWKEFEKETTVLFIFQYVNWKKIKFSEKVMTYDKMYFKEIIWIKIVLLIIH